MGQPRKVDKTGKSNGDARLTVRFTSLQLARLKKEAKKKRMSLGELVRLRALGTKRAA